jgi:hypothetical protein
LTALGEDIFRYFDWVAQRFKLLFQKDIICSFFEAIFAYQDVIHYENMLIITITTKQFLMSNFKLDNGFLTIKEDQSHASPISSVFMSFHDDIMN